jgi:hypothetical protein
MSREHEPAGSRKAYEAPKLTSINLRPEEAVLGHCKTPSGGPGGNVCNLFFGACVQTFGS